MPLTITTGSTVELLLNGKPLRCTIVSGPSDPGQNAVSASAPLARAILGRTVGERCSLVIHPPAVLEVVIKNIVCADEE